MTSREYASRVTGSVSAPGSMCRSEKRVTAMSKLCQKTWTGLVFPAQSAANSSSSRFTRLNTCHQSVIAVGSYAACSSS